MTPADTTIAVLATLQLIAVGLIAAAGGTALGVAKRAKRALDPPLKRGKAVAEGCKAIAQHAGKDVSGSVGRAKAAVERVRARYDRTARIARDIVPAAGQAAGTVGRRQQETLSTVRKVTALAQGLGKVHGAAESAARAARRRPTRSEQPNGK